LIPKKTTHLNPTPASKTDCQLKILSYPIFN
jgi:hypothetical protein